MRMRLPTSSPGECERLRFSRTPDRDSEKFTAEVGYGGAPSTCTAAIETMHAAGALVHEDFPGRASPVAARVI